MVAIPKFLRGNVKWFLLGLAVAVLGAWIYAYASPLRVSAGIAKAKLQKGEYDVVLDVRTKWERDNLGYRRGSAHVPAGDIEKEIPKLYPDKETRILAYCNSGQRARRAAEKLKAIGYKHVEYILGGYTSVQ